MRGFQIWYQNTNRITFDPHVGRKKSKIGKIPDLANFRQFFCHKEGEMLFDLNFDAIFGILSSFSIYNDSICYHFHVLNFFATNVIIASKMPAGPPFFEKM